MHMMHPLLYMSVMIHFQHVLAKYYNVQFCMFYFSFFFAVKDVCTQFTPFNQTAYRTAKTTITCDFPNEYNSSVKFICKDNNEICEEILSTQSSVKSNGTFTLTDTNSFNMSISNVRSQHAGVYWCGVKSKEGSYRVSLRKIQLKIKSE